MNVMTPEPLLYICHAPADHGWVHGHMLPALGLAAGQYRTRADDVMGDLQLAEIARAVEECRFTVLVASSAARADHVVQFAAGLAQHLTIEARTPRLIIVSRDPARSSSAEQCSLPLVQRAIVRLDCTEEQDTARSLARLRQLLELPEPVAAPVACPYPGLEPFTPANRHLMFGRDRDRDKLLHRIHAGHSRLLVLGPSGSGKSSLIHAAVLPELPPEHYLVRVMPRGGDLAVVLRDVVDTLEIPGAGPALDRYLTVVNRGGDIEQARASLRDGLAADPRRRIVVVDPLEEIFGVEPEIRATFLALLAGLWTISRCTVILSMRADFLGALMQQRCWRELEDCQVAVASLDEAGLRAAIVEPATQVGAHVDDALVERLLRECDRDRSAMPLPLLQVALQQIWARQTYRYLSLSSYEGVVDGGHGDHRGLAAAIAVHADGVLQALTAAGDRQLAQRILLDLVQLGEGRPHTRRRRTLDELRRSGDLPGALERVLHVLVEGRLVITGDGDGAAARGVQHVDLAHDALITGWGALARWVRDRHGDLVKHRHLEARARVWHEAGRTSGLLDDGDIAEVRAWCASPAGTALGVSERLLALTEASETARDRDRHEKDELARCLVEEQRRVRASADAAAEMVDDIAFQVDADLQARGGATRAREALLARARTVLDNLRAHDLLDDRRLWTEIAVKAAQAGIAVEHGLVDDAFRTFREIADQAARAGAALTSASRDHAPRRRTARGTPADARVWQSDAAAVYSTLTDGDLANTTWRDDLGASLERLGDTALASRNLEDARRWFEASLAEYTALVDARPASLAWQGRIAALCDKLAGVATSAGHVDDANAWSDRGDAARRELPDGLHPSPPTPAPHPPARRRRLAGNEPSCGIRTTIAGLFGRRTRRHTDD
jgi:hypothetical protein